MHLGVLVRAESNMGEHMPVIVFANQKGGAGKSTSCLLLATSLAEAGYKTVVLDCDPNRPIAEMYERRNRPHPSMSSRHRREERHDKIVEASKHYQFVLVDLEASRT